MTRHRKVRLLIAVTVMSVVVFGYGSVSYHGPVHFPTHTSSDIEAEEVVAAARRLSGTMYDPLMGKIGNVGGKLGFIVCSDVPVVAYGLAGYSFRRALADDFASQPSNYDTNAWNVPENPYFHRRARNLYAFFKGKGRLLSPSGRPMPGDLAFYKKANHTYATHVAVVSRVESKEEYWIVESAPKTIVAREVRGESPVKRGWVPLGFGRLLAEGEQAYNESLSKGVPSISVTASGRGRNRRHPSLIRPYWRTLGAPRIRKAEERGWPTRPMTS